MELNLSVNAMSVGLFVSLSLYVLSYLLFEHLHITLSSPLSIVFDYGVCLLVGKGEHRQVTHGHTLPVGKLC